MNLKYPIYSSFNFPLFEEFGEKAANEIIRYKRRKTDKNNAIKFITRGTSSLVLTTFTVTVLDRLLNQGVNEEDETLLEIIHLRKPHEESHDSNYIRGCSIAKKDIVVFIDDRIATGYTYNKCLEKVKEINPGASIELVILSFGESFFYTAEHNDVKVVLV